MAKTDTEETQSKLWSVFGCSCNAGSGSPWWSTKC